MARRDSDTLPCHRSDASVSPRIPTVELGAESCHTVGTKLPTLTLGSASCALAPSVLAHAPSKLAFDNVHDHLIVQHGHCAMYMSFGPRSHSLWHCTGSVRFAGRRGQCMPAPQSELYRASVSDPTIRNGSVSANRPGTRGPRSSPQFRASASRAYGDGARSPDPKLCMSRMNAPKTSCNNKHTRHSSGGGSHVPALACMVRHGRRTPPARPPPSAP